MLQNPCLARGGVCPISSDCAEVSRKSPSSKEKVRPVPQFPLFLQREELVAGDGWSRRGKVGSSDTPVPTRWLKDLEGSLFQPPSCCFYRLGPCNLQGRKPALSSWKKRETSQEFPKIFSPWEKMETVRCCNPWHHSNP